MLPLKVETLSFESFTPFPSDDEEGEEGVSDGRCNEFLMLRDVSKVFRFEGSLSSVKFVSFVEAEMDVVNVTLLTFDITDLLLILPQ